MNNIIEKYEIMFTSYPDLVDINQLREMLNIGSTLTYRLLKENSIKSMKIGRQYKIPKINIIDYLTTTNSIN